MQTLQYGLDEHIENLTKPILNPLITRSRQPHTLSPTQCAVLASWMTVKAVVLDAYAYREHGQRALFFTPAQCAFVMTKRVPPVHVSVWLGRMTRRGAPSGNVRVIHYLELGGNGLPNLAAFVSTFKFDEVWLQLIARRPKLHGARVPRTIRFATNPTSGTWDDFLSELWPSAPDAVHWPLSRSLGYSSFFDLLAHRLVGQR